MKLESIVQKQSYAPYPINIEKRAIIIILNT